MELKSIQVNEHGQQHQSAGRALGASLYDFNQQCLRVLRCTARAMASSPGGLRFKAGTRPWLEGLSVGGHAQALLVMGQSSVIKNQDALAPLPGLFYSAILATVKAA